MKHWGFIGLDTHLLEAGCQSGVLSRAREKKLIQLETLNLRDYAIDDRGTIDDRPYGGGDGMILRPEPLAAATDAMKQKVGESAQVLLLSARGEFFNDEMARELATFDKGLVFVCGRFGGVDHRFVEKHVDRELSIGPYVLSGGELPALAVADAIARHLDNSLGNTESAKIDSYSPHLGGQREHVSYTRPREWSGLSVPNELLSGDHKRIEKFREGSRF